MEKVIADAGPLVAYLKRDDKDHDWVKEVFHRLTGPLRTCDATLSEDLSRRTSILLPNFPPSGNCSAATRACRCRWPTVAWCGWSSCTVTLPFSRWTATFGFTGSTAGRRFH